MLWPGKIRVFIAVDTSGSVGGKEMALFLGEVQAILGAYPHLEAPSITPMPPAMVPTN